METISTFIAILFFIFLGILFLGMIRPWWVLWFLDYKDRLSVLKYYGAITILLGLAAYLSSQLI